MSQSWIVLQPIAILFIGSLLTPFIDSFGRALKFEKIRDTFAIIIFGLSLYSLLGIYEEVQRQGQITYFLSPYGPPIGVAFFVDQFSVFMAFLFCLLGLFVSIYSVKYMEEDTGLDKYYSLLMALVAGLVGVSFAGDLFNLFVFWEAMSLASYALVAFKKYRWEPIEASFKYLVMSTLGSLTALYAMSILYGLTGTLNISELAKIIPTLKTPLPQMPYLVIIAIIAGFGVTASIVPFHFWLPDAHPAAPSGISAMLSGVVIKAGVYAIARILFTIFNPTAFDFGTILVIFGIITLSVANFMALLQRDIKRLLAFSSIVNIGYIIFGFGIGAYALNVYGIGGYSIATLAIIGAIFHIFNHAIGKGLLFLGAGCFIHEAGTRDLIELEGAGKKMPWTGTSFSLGLLTLAGVPPLSGFWSKLFIILAGYTKPDNTFMITTTSIVVLNAIFAAAYYLWLMQRLMLKAPKPKVEKAHEVPILMILPVVILGLITVIIGLWPYEIIGFVEVATKSLLGLIGG
ncbi:MAG: cation:proton antiporter [archaeon]|nr:cation:proton antiporter [archaeon]